MFAAIIKDSIILFLLLYALINLAEQLLRFLSDRLLPKNTSPQGMYVLSPDGFSAESLEIAVRSYIAKNSDTIILITDGISNEQADIIKLLCNDFEQIIPMQKENLAQLLMTKTGLDISLKEESAESQVPGK